jgi:hypothetical protein
MVDLVLLVPTFIIALMPNIIQRWLWLAIRFTAKLSLTLWQSARTPPSEPLEPKHKKRDIELRVVPVKRREPVSPKGEELPKLAVQSQTAEERLADFLIFDVLVLISRDLHYQDLVNLSVTSKRIRQAVFPDGECQHRTRIFGLYTCGSNPSPKSCDGCGRRICVECSGCRSIYTCTPRSRKDQQLYKRHNETCQPWCLKCWNKTTNQDLDSRKSCACNETFVTVSLCSSCATLRDLDVGKRFARRQEYMEKRKRDLDLDCGSCSSKIEGIGPRWWVCQVCKRECRCHLHSAWNWERKCRPSESV